MKKTVCIQTIGVSLNNIKTFFIWNSREGVHGRAVQSQAVQSQGVQVLVSPFHGRGRPRPWRPGFSECRSIALSVTCDGIFRWHFLISFWITVPNSKTNKVEKICKIITCSKGFVSYLLKKSDNCDLCLCCLTSSTCYNSENEHLHKKCWNCIDEKHLRICFSKFSPLDHSDLDPNKYRH